MDNLIISTSQKIGEKEVIEERHGIKYRNKELHVFATIKRETGLGNIKIIFDYYESVSKINGEYDRGLDCGTVYVDGKEAYCLDYFGAENIIDEDIEASLEEYYPNECQNYWYIKVRKQFWKYCVESLNKNKIIW